jgi:sugar lactone lactonase YvrE
MELVVDARAVIGECPLWDPRADALWWVDIPRGAVHRYDPPSGEDLAVASLDEDVGAVALNERGGLLVALRGGFALLGDDGSLDRAWSFDRDDDRLRLNDGRCDPRGRFWVGTVRDDQAPGTAALHRLDPDGGAVAKLDGVTISNGLDWSPDGRTMYFADSGTGEVSAFEYDVVDGELGARRPFVAIDAAAGFPDGLCVDGEGFVWIAIFGASAVHRYDPDGSLERVVEVPARDVTSCAFGGPAYDELYVTSASERGAPVPSGGLFRCRPGPRGRPQTMWKGPEGVP